MAHEEEIPPFSICARGVGRPLSKHEARAARCQGIARVDPRTKMVV